MRLRSRLLLGLGALVGLHLALAVVVAVGEHAARTAEAAARNVRQRERAAMAFAGSMARYAGSAVDVSRGGGDRLGTFVAATEVHFTIVELYRLEPDGPSRPLLNEMVFRFHELENALHLRRPAVEVVAGYGRFTAALADYTGALQRQAAPLRQRAEALRSRAARIALGGPAIALLIALVIYTTVARPVLRGFRTLSVATRAVSRGGTLRDLPVADNGEMGELARAFAAMAERVRAQEQRLEAAVHERTRELEERVRELARARQQLELADRLAALGTLAAGVAHEINNPLAYLSSNLSYAREELTALLPKGARAQEVALSLDEAAEGAERVRQIVADLRSLSRTVDDPDALTDVHEVLDTAAKLALHAGKRPVRIDRLYGPVGRVRVGSARLGQVFLNLLINAVHAVEGVHEPLIEIRTRPGEGGRVAVAIADNGPGIPEGLRGRIFEPFFTTKEPGRGTGLGLAICHGIVTASGGQIEVGTAPGGGALFVIEFPAAA